ncbi:unnamed protein product [Clonostachys rosea]|uniref:HEAT repeat protein n=1 Tax=Bionectria ochroleuca TaxID=29856 RepID=A0ABY6UD09_BIOOC|nr:unnamed protein product [Clonostachys rosea]
MESAARNDERNKLFQKLKPCCVQISQLALRKAQEHAAQAELLSLTDQLLDILNDQIRTNPLALDEKLAEYTFFPLYHIFRQIEAFSTRLIENCVKSLNILVLHGWKSKISPEMAKQVLSLLTFIIDGVPGSKKTRHVDEETALEAFRGFTALFQVTAQSPTAAAGLAESEAIPALGHAITVMLDGVDKGANSSISIESLRAIQGVYTAIREQAALANFLPGCISILTKVLSAPARHKKLVLARCLSTSALILTRVLGDMQTRSIRAKAERKDAEDSDKTTLLSPAWLTATANQVKVALSNMMKLRSHDELEVRETLRSLCMTLLDECHDTLSNCSRILVETAIILDDLEAKTSFTETSLRDLISIYPELADEAKETVYGWLSSLPRLMQASDEDMKCKAVHSLSKGMKLLQDLGIESSTVQDTLGNALIDSIVSAMNTNKPQTSIQGTDVPLLPGTSGLIVEGSQGSKYPPIVFSQESQRGLRAEIGSLLNVLGSNVTSSGLATNFLEYIQNPGTVSQVAAFWACFELVKASHQSSADASELFDLSSFDQGDEAEDFDLVFRELYSFSVQTLDAHTQASGVDWRLEATALEVTAYAATRTGSAFRPELIDVLFPIVTFLGSDNPTLQQHGIVTLNSMAESCGYVNVSELIIENVDYMVNSIALRLNTLDISPASTNVLTMMIRLAGPRLVPFLDDVVESIFAALENYHGYTSFVESLFSVLQELVNQAVVSDMLLLDGQSHSDHKHSKKSPQVDGLKGLDYFISRRQSRKLREDEERRAGKSTSGHPTAPWGDEGSEKDEEMAGPEPEKEKSPNSVTYQLLLRITNLTQHYLTSPVPRLRRALLEILSKSSPALAADEDSFLPLINAIWPVVVDRLYDSETFISIEACHALSEICASGGDFLASRFETEWAGRLGEWCRKVKRKVQTAGSHSGASIQQSTSAPTESHILLPTSTGELVKSTRKQSTVLSSDLGQHASPVRVWEAVVGLLKSMLTYVKLTDLMFEEILVLLAEVMEKSKEVREALEVINADAVWIMRYDRGLVDHAQTPLMDKLSFAHMQPQAA